MNSNRHWSEWVRRQETLGEPYVLVTVLGARGSTPRDSGTKMVVSGDGFEGTIGGGTLEFTALERARQVLRDATPGQWVENFPLGEKLGQCCGGSTSILFESFVPRPVSLYLYGAGHVGRALAPLLSTLPVTLRWIDSRETEFPDSAPPGVRMDHHEDPVATVGEAPPGTWFVIMTHQHPLDYALMEAALRRDDAAYIGVIGSDSKARRFRLRLAHRGYDEQARARVHCPIGSPAVPGKRPPEIAVSIAAQLIGLYHTDSAEAPVEGPSWKQLQDTLNDQQLKIAGDAPARAGGKQTT